jgi:hypothetical protein
MEPIIAPDELGRWNTIGTNGPLEFNGEVRFFYDKTNVYATYYFDYGHPVRFVLNFKEPPASQSEPDFQGRPRPPFRGNLTSSVTTELPSKLTFKGLYLQTVNTDVTGKQTVSTEAQSIFCDGIRIDLLKPCLVPGPIETKQFGTFQMVALTNGEFECQLTPSQTKEVTKYLNSQRRAK